jgi:DNA-binding NarL/FixJ family response regulator
MTTSLRAVVAEDEPLLRRGIEQVLTDGGIDVVATFDRAEPLIDLIVDDIDVIDVAVMDIKMPPTYTDEGLRALESLRDFGRTTGVVLLSMYLDPSYAVRALARGEAGVGYLLKDRVADIAPFLDAVRRVATCGSAIDPEVVATLTHRPATDQRLQRLTTREREVLRLVAEGFSNRAIADVLVVSDKTTETHISHIFQKLDLPPTTEHHRRVLAALTWLDGTGLPSTPGQHPP